MGVRWRGRRLGPECMFVGTGGVDQVGGGPAPEGLAVLTVPLGAWSRSFLTEAAERGGQTADGCKVLLPGLTVAGAGLKVFHPGILGRSGQVCPCGLQLRQLLGRQGRRRR